MQKFPIPIVIGFGGFLLVPFTGVSTNQLLADILSIQKYDPGKCGK
jgi:hypothetical protein